MGLFDWLGGGTEDQNISRSAEPWGPVGDRYRDVIDQYWNFTQGFQPTYGPGQYAGLNQGQMQSLNDLFAMGTAGAPGVGQMTNFADSTMSGGPGPGYGFFNQMGQGKYGNPFAGLYENTFNDISSKEGLDSLRKFASGSYVGKNPYLDKMVNSGLSDIGRNWNESVNPAIEGMLGRSGSGGGSMEALLRSKSSGELADSMGQYETNTRGQAYETDMSRMLQASGMLPGAVATDAASKFAGLNAMSGVHQQDLQNQVTGFQNANNLRQQNWQNQFNAAGMYDDIWQQMLRGPEAALAAAGQKQSNDQGWLDEANRQHQWNQLGPLQHLQPMIQLLSGMQGLGGNETTTAPGRGSSIDTGIRNLSGAGSMLAGLFDWFGG